MDFPARGSVWNGLVWSHAPGNSPALLFPHCYSRTAVTGICDGIVDGASLTELGWEVYPAGLVECARTLHGTLGGPVWITENGCGDNGDAHRLESFRPRFRTDHLAAILDSDLPIERYYHWCFVDNWEWSEGENPRFGLMYLGINIAWSAPSQLLIANQLLQRHPEGKEARHAYCPNYILLVLGWAGFQVSIAAAVLPNPLNQVEPELSLLSATSRGAVLDAELVGGFSAAGQGAARSLADYRDFGWVFISRLAATLGNTVALFYLLYTCATTSS